MSRIIVTVLCLTASACAGAQEQGDPAESPEVAAQVSSALTYYRDIKPIVEERCAPCHTEGGAGHFSLTSYQDVEARAASIRSAVAGGRMPPWRASGPLDVYQDDRRLSPKQKQALLAWIDAGAPAGEPSEARAPAAPVRRNLSRVDLSLPVSQTYTPGRGDDYRCFVLDWPVTGTKYITGLSIEPEDKELVHHAIVYLVEPDAVSAVLQRDAADPRPGYSCMSGPGNSDWLQSYEPGGFGQDNPGGVGFEMQPGARLVLQVHYNTLQKQGTDRSRVDLMLSDRVSRVGEVELLMNPSWPARNMRIPANATDAVHEWEGRPSGLSRGQSYDLFWADLHMHTRGTSAKMGIVRARTGARESLLEIPAWSFEWQETYLFRQAVRLGPEDEFYVECHWDNTARNQPMIDGEYLPVRDVNWGEATTDEMCLGNVLATRATGQAVAPPTPVAPRTEPGVITPVPSTPQVPTRPQQPEPPRQPEPSRPQSPRPEAPSPSEPDWPWVDDNGFEPPAGGAAPWG